MGPKWPAVYGESTNAGAYSPGFRGDLGEAIATRDCKLNRLLEAQLLSANDNTRTIEHQSVVFCVIGHSQYHLRVANAGD